MNFITDMSLAKNSYTEKISDSMLMLLDKLIKYAIYVFITKNLNTKDFVNIM